MPRGKPQSIADFYNRLPWRPVGGCWEWSGYRTPKGYGTLSFKRKTWYAHRFSWQHVNGTIPPNMHVCHKCDNPCCCNPDHLFLGTHQDNMADMMRKKRHRAARGVESGCAKLTVADVKKIRTDKRTIRKIAAHYAIHQSTVGAIRLRQLWKHVP